jgi:hypothetical protein
LFAKLLEFFDDLLFFDAGAGEQTFKSGGCGAQGMEIGFQNWFTFGGNVKADGLAMPGYGDGILAAYRPLDRFEDRCCCSNVSVTRDYAKWVDGRQDRLDKLVRDYWD